jgi:microcystin-dependent protein
VATSSHVHNTGTLHAAIGATNGDTARIGYIAGGVYSGNSTYSVRATVGATLAGQAFNHNTPVVGQTDGPTSTATVGISNANATATNQATTATNIANTATNQATTATNVATGAGASENIQPTIILNYIIKV